MKEKVKCHERTDLPFNKSYHVYENWRAGIHKAVIHKAECGNCKNGFGQSGKGTRTDNGKWLGPFDTLEQTVLIARNTGGKTSYGKCCIKYKI